MSFNFTRLRDLFGVSSADYLNWERMLRVLPLPAEAGLLSRDAGGAVGVEEVAGGEEGAEVVEVVERPELAERVGEAVALAVSHDPVEKEVFKGAVTLTLEKEK